MKYLTFPLLIVTLCLASLFSCGDTTSKASVDESEKTGIRDEKNNPTDKLSKKEVIDRMNKANQMKMGDKPMTEAEKLVHAKKNQKAQRIGADQAKQSSLEMRRRYEEVKDLPPTEEQKKAADEICSCLNDKKIFRSINKMTSTQEIEKKIGAKKNQEVKALQDCYNNIMVPKVNNMGKDAGIFAMKSRSYLNKQCLNGTDKFWVAIGGYINKTNNTPDGIQVPNVQKATN